MCLFEKGIETENPSIVTSISSRCYCMEDGPEGHLSDRGKILFLFRSITML